MSPQPATMPGLSGKPRYLAIHQAARRLAALHPHGVSGGALLVLDIFWRRGDDTIMLLVARHREANARLTGRP